jgi:hypothetical protein
VGPDVDNQADIGIVAADNFATLMCVAMVASKQNCVAAAVVVRGSSNVCPAVRQQLLTCLSFARSIVVSILTHD